MTHIEEKAHLVRRERFYMKGPEGNEVFFWIRNDDVAARKSLDVELVYHSRISWQGGSGEPLPCLDEPACPDCGGQILWAEAGGVPGSRKCNKCGSRYVDTTYGIASEVPA